MSQVASFDSETHTYRLDGEPVPSVTGIMRDCGLVSDYRFVGWHHRYRGSAVHQGCAIIATGGEPRFRLNEKYARDPECQKVFLDLPQYMLAFKEALATIRFFGTVFECAMIHPRLRYAGTFDFAALSSKGDRKQLWDIKSGVMPELVCIQIAAYQRLVKEGIPVNPDHPGYEWLHQVLREETNIERAALRLEKTGRWTSFFNTSKGESYQDGKFDVAWDSALFLHRYVYGHEVVEHDDQGHPYKRSMLRDLDWTAKRIRETMTGKTRETALRAGQNLFHIRQQYGLL